jgi:hypothetical protein
MGDIAARRHKYAQAYKHFELALKAPKVGRRQKKRLRKKMRKAKRKAR